MREMTCREFDEAVHAFVRMELLDIKMRDAVLEHAARCDFCAERMADAIALAEASEAVGSGVRELQTPPRVESELLAAFRSHRHRVLWRKTLEWAVAGAAAAVILVFAWTMSGRSREHAPPVPRKDISSQSNQPVEANGAVRAPSEERVPQASVEDFIAPPSETYVASDFVPVPFAGGINPDDPGMIVRVQLTRASLAQLGYPVAETPDEDLVRADVLLGEDGWPRGVKLIQ